MNTVAQSPIRRTPAEDVALRWIGRAFYFSTLIGLSTFGIYILLRGTGVTFKNFDQWNPLISGLPLPTLADWIANIGIGMHFVMGSVLVLAWPILLSTRIRVRYRVVHRWTGRVYVTAGFLAGVGGLSFILARHTGIPDHTAFAIWGSLMMLCSVMAYVYARAKRFDLHRAWAIRLFAMVFGAWGFDLELKAWENLTGGAGLGDEAHTGPAMYVLLYFFFVPNLLVAEYFIRNKHKRVALGSAVKWPAIIAIVIVGALFVYAIYATTAVQSGKFGGHLLSLLGG